MFSTHGAFEPLNIERRGGPPRRSMAVRGWGVKCHLTRPVRGRGCSRGQAIVLGDVAARSGLGESGDRRGILT